MRQNKYYILLFLVFLFGVGCTQDPEDKPSEPTETVDMRLSMGFTRGGSMTGVDRDKQITHANLYVFGKNTHGVYYLLENVIAKNISYASISDKYSLTATLKATAKPVMILLIANQPEGQGINLGVDGDGSDVTRLVTPEDLMNINVGTETKPIPMSARIDLPKGISTSTADPNVELLRAMARVDMSKAGTVSDATFTIVGMSVWFSPDRGMLMSDHQTGSVVTAPTLPTTFVVLPQDYTNEGISSSPIRWENTTGVASIVNKIFIYENKNFATIPDGDKRNSRMVVWGYYNESLTLSYYGIDFTKSDNVSPMAILRNHRYLVSINKVKNSGYDDEREAAFSESIGISAEIIEWEDNNQDIIFDGSHWFSIESKAVIVGGEFGSVVNIGVGSTVASADWAFAWGTTDVFPSDDTAYKTGNTLPDADGGAAIVSVTKPVPPITSDADIGRTLTIRTLKSATDTRYLFIKVNSRLQMRIKVNIVPDGYTVEDWENEGDQEIELS